MADTYDDTLGDSGVATPPRQALTVAIVVMAVVAAIGFYLGLNTADHRTRLPGDTSTAGVATGVDFSRARVAVALQDKDLAPAPVAAPPLVQAPTAAPVVEAPVAQAPAAPVVEAPPPPAPAAPAAAPPSLDGLF